MGFRSIEDSGVLTPRQEQVCELAFEGLKNPAIAERLGISHGAVKGYRSSAASRLGCTGPALLGHWAAFRMERERKAFVGKIGDWMKRHDEDLSKPAREELRGIIGSYVFDLFGH